MPDALRQAGATVEVLADHFAPDTDDETVLAAVGTRRWVFLSKDSNIRRHPLERQTLLNAGVKAFLLSAAGLSGTEQTEVFVKTLPKIRRVCRLPGPFIARITAAGKVDVVEDRSRQTRRRGKFQRRVRGSTT